MISRAVTLLLVVTATVSGRIIQRPRSHPHQMLLMPTLSSGCPSALEPAPLICKFMQPADSHYKPPLIAPSTYIPPLVMEKCDSPRLEIELPAPDKPVAIPQAPVLPPITIPKFPVPVMVEKPILPPVPIAEPCESAFLPEVPEIPALSEMVAPEPCLDEVVVPKTPMVVPQPPELPAFVMPELPVRVDAPMPEPCLEDHPIPVAPIPEYIPPAYMPLPIVEPVFVPDMPAMKIPAAPELPPFEMPVLPEIAAQPEPCFDEVVIPEIPHQPVVVPQPPELPAFVMPELPVRVEAPMAEPCLEDQLIHVAPFPEYMPPAPMLVPIAVPQPPELPAFEMPELPIRVEAAMAEPCLEDQLIPAAPEYIPAFLPEVPAVIPMAPTLPPMVMPALPKIKAQPEPCLSEIITPEVDYKPLVLPQAPVLPAFVMPELPIRTDPTIAPCPEDLPAVSIPEYIQPLAPMPAAPELPKAPLPEIPAHVEMQQPVLPAMTKHEDPCVIGEIALIVPQQPKSPEPIAMPIIPTYPQPAMVDPCEPSTKKMPEVPHYFVRQPSRHPILPMSFGFYNQPAMPVIPHAHHYTINK